MTDLRFFQRLDRIDLLLQGHGPEDLAAELATVVLEPVSAEYLAEHDSVSSTRRQPARLLLDVAAVLSPRLTQDYEVAVDILEAQAIRLSASGGEPVEGIPTVRTPRQLRALAEELKRHASELTPQHVAALGAALARVHGVDSLDPRDLSQLIRAAVQSSGFAAAETAFDAGGFTTPPERRGGHADWWRGQVLKGVLPELASHFPSQSFRFFRSILMDALESDPAMDHVSTLWRPQIQPSGSSGDWRNQSLDGFLVSAQSLLRRTDFPDVPLLEALWHAGPAVFKRCALWLATLDEVSGVQAFIEERVTDVARDGVAHEWETEMRDLLQAKCEALSVSSRGELLSWIDAGPKISSRTDLDPDDLASLRGTWRRDWLAVVEPILTPDFRDLLLDLKRQFGPVSEARWERGVRSGFVEQVSPVSSEEMLAWPLPEVGQRLADALDAPEIGKWQDFKEVSREGLMRAVAQVIPQRPEWLATRSESPLQHADSRAIVIQALAKLMSDDRSLLPPDDVAGFLNWALREGRLDQNSLWAAARTGESLLDTDWPESTSPSTVAKLVDVMVRRTAGHPPQSPDDPATAALNTPAGISSNLACRAYLILSAKDRLSADAQRMLRRAIEALLAREAVDTHAAVGQWYSELVAADPGWASEIQSNAFPEDESLFAAAWGAYVRYGRLRPGTMQRLDAEYQRVVIEEIDFGPEHVRDEILKSTTQHILILAAWGEIAVEPPGALLTHWFDRLPIEHRAEAHSYLAREAGNEDLPDDIRHRMQQVVEWRLQFVESEPEEFEHLGMWASAIADPGWKLQILREVGPTGISPMHGTEVLEFLALTDDLADTEGIVEVARSALERADSWRLRSWLEPITQILEQCLQEPASREAALALADDLGQRGLLELRPLFDTTSAP